MTDASDSWLTAIASELASSVKTGPTWAAGPGGNATAFATNAACEQPFLGNLATWYYIAPNAPMCGPAAILSVDLSIVRLALSSPSPFPEGLMLCQASCP